MRRRDEERKKRSTWLRFYTCLSIATSLPSINIFHKYQPDIFFELRRFEVVCFVCPSYYIRQNFDNSFFFYIPVSCLYVIISILVLTFTNLQKLN